jgi:hypothetical protein
MVEYRGCGLQQLEWRLHQHGLFGLLINLFRKEKVTAAAKHLDDDNQVPNIRTS